jgi:hypothetical protein
MYRSAMARRLGAAVVLTPFAVFGQSSRKALHEDAGKKRPQVASR